MKTFKVTSLLLISGFLLAVSSAWANTGTRFYSQKGIDVDVQFSTYIDIEGSEHHALHLPHNVSTYVNTEIRKSLNFMAGPLQYTTPNAGPRYDHNIQILRVQYIGNDTWRAHFNYSGRFIVAKEGWENLVIYLPINSKRIYDQGQISGATDPIKKNPCVTNTLYLESHQFWYFWNPHNTRGGSWFTEPEKCPLQQGVHYHKITPQVAMRNHSEAEFSPEYEKLVHTNAYGERELEVLLIYGSDKDELATDDPYHSRDHNAANFVAAVRGLQGRGERRTVLDDPDFRPGRQGDDLAPVRRRQGAGPRGQPLQADRGRFGRCGRRGWPDGGRIR